MLQMTDEKQTVWEELDPFMTPEEVGKVLKVSLSTVKRYLYNGELKGEKIGRQWRISRDALRDFFEKDK